MSGEAWAFPSPVFTGTPGMTTREYMATHILSGLLADPNRNGTTEAHAAHAVKFTDALLAELEKPTHGS